MNSAEKDFTEPFREAVDRWLALVDAGRYAGSWDAAAAFFQASVGKSAWMTSIHAARAPLGAVSSRVLKSARLAYSLPGAPDGVYFVVQYDSAFAHAAKATETITLMKAQDDAWNVAGYFVDRGPAG